jgi:endonuclease/exonuclease/phosphatase family metal-dependent hydrolase
MKLRFAVSTLVIAAGLHVFSLAASAQVEIKVVQWNVRDNSANGGTAEEPDELTAIVNQAPDVLILQEVDRVAHLNAIAAALETNQPGTDWQQRNINRTNTTTGQSFLAILTRFPIANVNHTLLTAEGEVIAACPNHPRLAARAAIGATITVDGKPFAVFSTRNEFISGDCVAAEQNRRFKAWANAAYPTVTHLYGGDFNMLPTGQAYPAITTNPTAIDAWREALDKRTATAANDSTPDFLTPTRNNRLDYLFYKNAGTVLSVRSARITSRPPTSAPSPDGFASDHRMMTAMITVAGSAPLTLPADDFNDNSLDPKWTIGVWTGDTRDATVRVAEVNQRLEIGPLKERTTGSHYNGLRSTANHDFSGASAYVQLVHPAATTTAAFAMFAVGRDSNNYYRWYVSAGRLVAEKEIAGAKTTLVDVGYNPIGHQFLRICHDASARTVVFQTAPNTGGAPGTWFQHRAEPWSTAAIPLRTARFEMKAGTGAAEIAPGTAAYDNFRAARVASCQ